MMIQGGAAAAVPARDARKLQYNTHRMQYITHWTDHGLDRLDPNLCLRSFVHDRYVTDLTHEACARSCSLYGSHPAT